MAANVSVESERDSSSAGPGRVGVEGVAMVAAVVVVGAAESNVKGCLESRESGAKDRPTLRCRNHTLGELSCEGDYPQTLSPLADPV